ncbi:MAG TPA: chemotaxis protein CheW [Methylomirabilota bacterium]|nr:chemotaxis protein CheW [Methylomirabilota bacterium]
MAELERAPIRRACVVLLGGRPFAVDIADAREVIVLDTLTRVPGAPAPVLGIMNLRGVVLAVVDARPLLGLPARPAAGRGRALVLADGGRRAAMQIERVLGLTVFEHVPPSTERASHGELAVGELAGEPGGPATLLDARAVLAALRRPWDSVLGGS